MSFEGEMFKGDRVEYVYEEGVFGTVVYTFCDYGEHRVAVTWDDEEAKAEIGYEMYESAVLLVEDPYEYNIESTDLVTEKTHLYRGIWEPDTEWLQRELDERNAYDRKLLNIPGGGPLEYSRKLVKRRKAGEVEDA